MDLHLTCFLNTNRPFIQNSLVREIPVAMLGNDLAAQLDTSLRVDPSDGLKCAASARLWERLLEDHRIPYLSLRVADMRMTLGSKMTALLLYEELQNTLQDSVFGDWIVHRRSAILAEVQEQLHSYRYDPSLGFTPSQRWRSTIKMDGSFPYCRLQQAEVNNLRDEWEHIDSPQDLHAKYFNMHCLETNAIEGTIQFDPNASTRLIQVGFYNQMEPISDADIQGGVVRNLADALSVLQATHMAMSQVFSLLESDSITLTVDEICRLHKTLMRTSCVLYITTGSSSKFSHLNAGTTRQHSCVNVTAGLREQKVKIQFCPYDEVDSELAIFCERFNEFIQKDEVDPFAAAAWISHVFVTIHPFEDGNGRISRILASIPLVKRGLPPLCLPAFYKQGYNILLNNIRSNRDGDYQPLMQLLYDGTKSSLQLLKVIQSAQA